MGLGALRSETDPNPKCACGIPHPSTPPPLHPQPHTPNQALIRNQNPPAEFAGGGGSTEDGDDPAAEGGGSDDEEGAFDVMEMKVNPKP